MVACVSKVLKMSISKATHSVFILFIELVQYEQNRSLDFTTKAT